MDPTAVTNTCKNLRRIYAASRLNMDLLDVQLTDAYESQYDDVDEIKIGRTTNSSMIVPAKLKKVKLPAAAAVVAKTPTPQRKRPAAPPPKKKPVAKKKVTPAKPAARSKPKPAARSKPKPAQKKRPGPASKSGGSSRKRSRYDITSDSEESDYDPSSLVEVHVGGPKAVSYTHLTLPTILRV